KKHAKEQNTLRPYLTSPGPRALPTAPGVLEEGQSGMGSMQKINSQRPQACVSCVASIYIYVCVCAIKKPDKLLHTHTHTHILFHPSSLRRSPSRSVCVCV